MDINSIIEYVYHHHIPNLNQTLFYENCERTICLNYLHPDKHNEEFIATDWLCERLFKLNYTSQQIYWIILNILLERSFLFVSNDIENLTSMVLGFAYLIKPFKWPFILIPNLPIDLPYILESPIPYLAGLLNNHKSEINSLILTALQNNTIVISNYNNGIEIFQGDFQHKIKNFTFNFAKPSLMDLENFIHKNLEMAQYNLRLPKHNIFMNYTKLIYKQIYANIFDSLIKPLESIYSMTVKLNSDKVHQNEIFKSIKNFYQSKVCMLDKEFCIKFCESQIFACYYHEDILK